MAKARPGPKKKAARKASMAEIGELKSEGVDVRRPWLREWMPLLAKYPTPTALAEELGVSYQTLRRWGAWGDPVPSSSQKLIRFVATSKGVTSPV